MLYLGVNNYVLEAKVMRCSIGGYNIQNYLRIEEGTGRGYSADLYKGDRRIAKILDTGTKHGLVVRLAKSVSNSDEEFYRFVLRDLKELLSHMTKTLEKGGLYESFLVNSQTAAAGFTSLLIDLQGIVGAYDKVKQKDDNFYIVGSFGGNWFSKDGGTMKTTHFKLHTNTSDYDEAYKQMLENAKRKKKKLGRLVAGAVLLGDMDWNLSFEDYSELYNP